MPIGIVVRPKENTMTGIAPSNVLAGPGALRRVMQAAAAELEDLVEAQEDEG